METFSVGEVVQGFGLSNAGRFATVKAVGKTAGRVQLELHLTGRVFWTWTKFWRLAD